MDSDDYNKLYLVSHLIKMSEGKGIKGYSDLAVRLEHLKNEIRRDNRLNDEFYQEIRDLVFLDEEDTLDWTGLKDLVERAKEDEYGSMFINVKSDSMGPNKWIHEFESNAPLKVLENKLEEMVGPENDTIFLEKVDSAARIDEDDVIEEVYDL